MKCKMCRKSVSSYLEDGYCLDCLTKLEKEGILIENIAMIVPLIVLLVAFVIV